MDDSPLSEVLILCQEVTNENKTDDLYSTLEVFLMKNYAKIAKEPRKVVETKSLRKDGEYARGLLHAPMQICLLPKQHPTGAQDYDDTWIQWV